MIGASSLAFPGSKTLASWWRQLAPWQPLAFWVGHLFLHRVEALVGSVQSQPLDPFGLFLLKALALEGAAAAGEAAGGGPGAATEVLAPVALERLDARLTLGPSFLLQALRRLAADGLVETAGRGQWLATPLGRQALGQGHFGRYRHDRRLFPFVERINAAGQRLASPHFLNLRDFPGIPWQPGDDCRFQVEWLQAALDHGDAWKGTFGFPRDVRSIAGVSPSQAANHQPGAEEPLAWQRIIVDHAERLLVVLVLAGADPAAARLLGLAARQEGWSLQGQEPLFVLDQGWPEIFPELTSSTQPVSARVAWQNWGKTAGLQAAETDAGEITGTPSRLCVLAPEAVVQRLRGLRSDVFKGDTWLLLGEGRLRAAATLEVVSAG